MIIMVPKVSSYLQMKVQVQSYLMHTTTSKEPQQSLLLLRTGPVRGAWRKTRPIETDQTRKIG